MTADTTDLVARLRAPFPRSFYVNGVTGSLPICDEAADAITALAAENARLRDGWARDMRGLAALAVERRADADALADALRTIRAASNCASSRDIARAALAAYERTKG